MRASLTAERSGVPSVTIVETGFMLAAGAVTRSHGVELAIAEYPGQVQTDTDGECRAKLTTSVTDAVVAGLARQVAFREADEDPDTGRPVFKGSLAEIGEHFYEQGWTDGLPVVPPTPDRVAAFLRYTERDADDVVAVLEPANREATIRSIAVNGVMAGCLPQYMPLLVAAVECVADPEYGIEHAGSTPGWEPLVIVNGPVVEELGFNTETGAMRAGPRANTSVGRFLNLYMRNVAGMVPGLTSKGTIGANFNVALAESTGACLSLGWEPMSVDTRGFTREDDVVTVRSVVSVTGPTYSVGDDPKRHLEALAEFIGMSTSALWSVRTGQMYRKWSALYVISPMTAKVLARAGYTKRDVARYLYDSCWMPASLIERYWRASHRGDPSWSLEADVVAGLLPGEYLSSDDPDRPIRVNMRPEWIEIVLAGDPARNQARGYMNNHEQGFPVSKKVRLPPTWPEPLQAPAPAGGSASAR